MKHLRIHYLQHVPFEDLGCIEEWVFLNGHQLSCTRFYESTMLPDTASFDWLIIMGGPMGVYDVEAYPWLENEKLFIQQAIEQNKTVLGICLGAQLIASCLGAKVYKNKMKEIGWFPIKTSNTANSYFTNNTVYTVFHWHGDTFDLPTNATRLATSEACVNQAFVYNTNVIGLQFHLEVTEKSIKKMIDFEKDELLVKEQYIQTENEISEQIFHVKEGNQLVLDLLNSLSSK